MTLLSIGPRRRTLLKPDNDTGPADPVLYAANDDSGRTHIRLGLIVIGLFFGVLGTWAAFAPLDAGVTASGVVVVSGNRQTVQHRDGGIVSRIHVKEGDRVRKDQILLELADVELNSQYNALLGEAIELEALRSRLLSESAHSEKIAPPPSWARLRPEEKAIADAVLLRQQQELDIRRASLGAQSGVLRQREAQLQARIGGYRAQIASTDEQIRLINEELEGVRTLSAKGLVPLTRVRALERTAADLVGTRASLTAQIEQARQGIGESSLQNLSLREGRSEDIAADMRSADTRLADVLPKLEAARAQLDRSLIRAPTSGTVVGLTVFTEGGVVRAGEKLMDIVPDAQPLVVEAKIRPEDADDLRIGMKTQVRFTAFRDRSLPLAMGALQRVSADRFTDEHTGAGYFLAEVTVPPGEIKRIAATRVGGAALRAGLPVEIVVPLRSRTALQYLLEPLDHAMWTSFREH